MLIVCCCLHGTEPAPKASSITRNSNGCAVWLCLHAIISSTRRSAFQKRLRFFLHAILPRPVREQDHATHETLELAERESPFDWALHSHCCRGDRVSRRRALGADARSLLGGNRDSVVMQSTLGATLTLSVERIVATAVGASVGALESNYFGANLAAFMLAIFFIGLLSFGFRLEKTAYRYASVTLTIIVLIPRTNPAWIVALHRFIEVSVGIVIALLVVAIWPERHPVPAKRADE